MNEKTLIGLKNIEIMCRRPEAGNVYKENAQKDTFDSTQSEFEPEHNKWLSFKARAKDIWSKAKRITTEIASCLVIIKSLLKASTGVMREFAKFRQARKAFA